MDSYAGTETRAVAPDETPASTPVFVLCGGLGTRFREQTEFRPKPMIEIGGRPILWHIMRSYARHGFSPASSFCLGYRGEMIKEYFLHYTALNSDFTVKLVTSDVTMHSVDHLDDWTVTLVDTGDASMTGARVALAAADHLDDAPHFAITYGDGLTDADLGQ